MELAIAANPTTGITGGPPVPTLPTDRVSTGGDLITSNEINPQFVARGTQDSLPQASVLHDELQGSAAAHPILTAAGKEQRRNDVIEEAALAAAMVAEQLEKRRNLRPMMPPLP